MEVKVYCCMCENTFETEVDMPKGWAHQYDAMEEEENGFCPKHSLIATGFCDQQCVGCVGGWGDCDLWRAFAYTSSRSITEKDLMVIKTGHCPYRVGGTIAVGPFGVRKIDISERGETAAGKLLAKSIRDYIKAYPSEAA